MAKTPKDMLVPRPVQLEYSAALLVDRRRQLEPLRQEPLAFAAA